MSKFHVHLYATVRVKMCDVEAADQGAAVREAVRLFDGDATFSRFNENVAYADEITAALVDTVGDEQFSESRTYTPDGEPDSGAARRIDAATVAEAITVLRRLHATLEGEWADPAAYGMPIENPDHNHHDDMMALRGVIAKLPSP
jgi:hypothetical protein